MAAPANPQIYHIVHVDRLASIVGDQRLWSDAQLISKGKVSAGTTIGMSSIKARRLSQLTLMSHPGLHVGECVPFYFCPRSIMLFLIYCRNSELTYQGGQEDIIHLEGDLRRAVSWAHDRGKRWAFSLSNAGSTYFEDRCNLDHLDEIDWASVKANRWSGPNVSRQVKEGKQAEFLLERSFPWKFVEKIGVYSKSVAQRVALAMEGSGHRPPVEIRRDWYY